MGARWFPCALAITPTGISFECDGPFAWSASTDWRHLRDLDVSSGSDGTVLTMDSQRLRFPTLSVPEVEALVAPYVPLLGTGLKGPSDVQSSGEQLGDMDTTHSPTGGEVWYSDRIAHEYSNLVDESTDWIATQDGVEDALREDRELVLVTGRFDERLITDLRHWWSTRVEDFAS